MDSSILPSHNTGHVFVIRSVLRPLAEEFMSSQGGHTAARAHLNNNRVTLATNQPSAESFELCEGSYTSTLPFSAMTRRHIDHVPPFVESLAKDVQTS